MGRVISVDSDACTGCRTCMLVCSVTKSGSSSPYLSRIGVVGLDRLGRQVPMLCVHCRQAPCIACCPVDAISRNPSSGAVEVDGRLCIGCAMCVSACPFGCMSMDPAGEVAVNCDLCGGSPACVSACPFGALKYEEPAKTALARKRSKASRIAQSLDNSGR